jgi:tetratricopeptide (TPR) repeat protein
MKFSGEKKARVWPIARTALAVVLLVVLFQASWRSARAGFASLLSTYAVKSNKIAAAQAALSINQNDPDAHYVRGMMLEAIGTLPAAAEEYAQAVRLRSNDYVLWLALAQAQELKGDSTAALAAARQAVVLAPYYAQPHWQLGNILVRARQIDEGFRELCLAGESDPNLMPAIIDLAWQLSGNDIEFVKRVVRPQSPSFYKALAEYFKKQDRVTEAIEMFNKAGQESEPERERYMEELITARRFSEAAVLWSMEHPQDSQNMILQFRNPGFEFESNLDKPGFAWRQDNKAVTLSLTLDPNKPKEGRTSLRVDFNGDSDPGTPVISQLIFVEPRTRYQLRFAARAEALVSGGLPLIMVSNATHNNVLGQTAVFTRAAVEWQDYVLDFDSGENITTIQLMLRRLPCSSSPCPIFGRLWLDNFSIRKL